ncbi:MAG TPA: PhzF family phenazine biosynthesis protein [Thermoanaerobaculia bacterium]|nr:PhzF family phenazine biosynthesis protein [Thermoanaerobaculia bacterium]
MIVQRIAAFSDGNAGGNPAGVVIAEVLPSESDMQRVAAEVGFSETAFAMRQGTGWRVRYFSPESEVPFCGHATIALGAALTAEYGEGTFDLTLNDATIRVEGRRAGELIAATLQSPPTRSAEVAPAIVDEALALFGYRAEDLDPRLPPARIHAGADHLLLPLRNRELLAAMRYDLGAGRTFMRREGFVTVTLAYAETPRLFHTRNAFASGGVYEDPATGAATAALAGYLRERHWPHGGAIEIVQGEDMGSRSRLTAEIAEAMGSSIRVSGTTRAID